MHAHRLKPAQCRVHAPHSSSTHSPLLPPLLPDFHPCSLEYLREFHSTTSTSLKSSTSGSSSPHLLGVLVQTSLSSSTSPPVIYLYNCVVEASLSSSTSPPVLYLSSSTSPTVLYSWLLESSPSLSSSTSPLVPYLWLLQSSSSPLPLDPPVLTGSSSPHQLLPLAPPLAPSSSGHHCLLQSSGSSRPTGEVGPQDLPVR